MYSSFSTKKRIAAVVMALAFILTGISGMIVFASEGSDDNFTLYTVRKGDSVYSIAKGFGISEEDIVADNDLEESRKILAGQVLKLRTKAEPAAAEGSQPAETNSPATGKISLDVRDADLRDVLSALAVHMNCNIILTEDSSKVNFSAQNIYPLTAMEYLLKGISMDYIKNGSTIIVGRQEKLSKEFFSSMVLTRFALRHIQADNLGKQIDKLGIKVQKITLDESKKYIWVQGTPQTLAKVRELVTMLDRPENFTGVQGGGIKPELRAVTLQYIKAGQMSEIMRGIGLLAGTMMLDTNPQTL